MALVTVLAAMSLILLGEALAVRRADLILGTSAATGDPGPPAALPTPAERLLQRIRPRVPFVVAAIVVALLSSRLVGLAGIVVGIGAGLVLPFGLARRRRHHRTVVLEQQLAEVVEVISLAVRSGLSISQGVEFAAGEASPPMQPLLDAVLLQQSLGVPLERALRGLADELGTDDARLFVLILSIHLRSGGNLAGALQEVAATIRHRAGVRRELRGLTAQGRISGTVLGALPIGFSIVLAVASRHDLAPVYRSPLGIVMVSVGLGLEGLAYLWIRHLLKVQV
jgi:tight adherence protein B